jgi:hypothetical protein
MYRYFDYWDRNDIEIFYCNTYSKLIKERDLDEMNIFISKEYIDLKIDERYNMGGTIISQGKFILRGYADANNRRKI